MNKNSECHIYRGVPDVVEQARSYLRIPEIILLGGNVEVNNIT